MNADAVLALFLLPFGLLAEVIALPVLARGCRLKPLGYGNSALITLARLIVEVVIFVAVAAVFTLVVELPTQADAVAGLAFVEVLAFIAGGFISSGIYALLLETRYMTGLTIWGGTVAIRLGLGILMIPVLLLLLRVLLRDL